MFWKRRPKCTQTIYILLPEDFEETYKYSRAISKYLYEYHINDIREGRIAYDVVYSNSMRACEIRIYDNCEFDIPALHDYIAEHAKSTNTIMKGE